MPGPRTYPPGVTCWIDCEVPDPPAAARFYGELFGWQTTEAMPAEVPGTYLIATLDGQDVAAITSSGSEGVRWNTYVAVDDMDRTAAAFLEAGGQLEVFEARPPGRSAFGTDPAGAPVRLWQAGRRLGAQLANVPGAWNFSDLLTPDPDVVTRFYAPVFGWRAVAMADDAGTMIQVPGYGDHLAATIDPGIRERQASAPEGFADVIGGLVVDPDVRAHWQVTFTVADRDASVATAVRCGATVLSSTEETWTRRALLRDPQGAELVVSQFTPPQGDWS